MRVDSITFNGYRHRLKTLWRKGKLPSVTHGFYGDKLTQGNISLEHLQPRSKHGRSILANFVLASQEKNNNRGNRDIKQFANKQTVFDYLKQFVGVRAKDFNGDKYIEQIVQTLKGLGLDMSGKIR